MTCPLYLQLCSLGNHIPFTSYLKLFSYNNWPQEKSYTVLYSDQYCNRAKRYGHLEGHDDAVEKFAGELDHEESFVGNSRRVELYEKRADR